MSFRIPPASMDRLKRSSREDCLDPGNAALCIGLLVAAGGPYLLAGSQTAFKLHAIGRSVPTLDAAFRTVSAAHGPQLGIDAIGGIVFTAATMMPSAAAAMLLGYLRPAARDKLRKAVSTSLANRLRRAVILTAGSGTALLLAPLFLAAFGGRPDAPEAVLATLLLVMLTSMWLSFAATRALVDIAVASVLGRRGN